MAVFNLLMLHPEVSGEPGTQRSVLLGSSNNSAWQTSVYLSKENP